MSRPIEGLLTDNMVYAKKVIGECRYLTWVDDGLGEPFLMIGNAPLSEAGTKMLRGAIARLNSRPPLIPHLIEAHAGRRQA